MIREIEKTRARQQGSVTRTLFVILSVTLMVNALMNTKALGQEAVQIGVGKTDPSDAGTIETNVDDEYALAKQRMVEVHLKGRDIDHERVLDAMRDVPRHEFVRPPFRHLSYSDSALPIGVGQTISQPYIVALMTQLADPHPTHKALDIGTGSGYQAAVLSKLVDEVYSIEIVESLAKEARERLGKLRFENVVVRHGDGYSGWKALAPFDVIIVAAAPDHVPPALIEQLAPGGKLIIPVGDRMQSLNLIEKGDDGSVTRRQVIPVRFVPMTGAAED